MPTPNQSGPASTDRGEQAGLQWGVKKSFLRYIAQAPDGSATIDNGASALNAEELMFPLVVQRPKPNGPGQELVFGGSVTFRAHAGMLLVPLANPRVLIHGRKGVLDIDDPFDPERLQRLPLVAFEVANFSNGAWNRWAGSSVGLTEGGVRLFNNVYQEGEVFEPLTIAAPRQSTLPRVSGHEKLPIGGHENAH